MLPNPPHCPSRFQRGLTLLEMSIVLVVVGGLIGAVISGQHLIHTMKLRQVMDEKHMYVTAISQFVDRYKALPGDMPNATDYWGAVDSGNSCMAPTFLDAGYNTVGQGTGTETCNGDGIDLIAEWSATNMRAEAFRAWQHLSNAGLIEGTYTGVMGAGSSFDHDVGINAPKGPFTRSGWGLFSINDYRASGSGGAADKWFNHAYGNVLTFGRDSSGEPPNEEVLTPAEAWAIDDKFDDSMPATGEIFAWVRDISGASACTTAAGDSSDLTATYDTSIDTISCAFIFKLPQGLRGRF